MQGCAPPSDTRAAAAVARAAPAVPAARPLAPPLHHSKCNLSSSRNTTSCSAAASGTMQDASPSGVGEKSGVDEQGLWGSICHVYDRAQASGACFKTDTQVRDDVPTMQPIALTRTQPATTLGLHAALCGTHARTHATVTAGNWHRARLIVAAMHWPRPWRPCQPPPVMDVAAPPAMQVEFYWDAKLNVEYVVRVASALKAKPQMPQQQPAGEALAVWCGVVVVWWWCGGGGGGGELVHVHTGMCVCARALHPMGHGARGRPRRPPRPAGARLNHGAGGGRGAARMQERSSSGSNDLDRAGRQRWGRPAAPVCGCIGPAGAALHGLCPSCSSRAAAACASAAAGAARLAWPGMAWHGLPLGRLDHCPASLHTYIGTSPPSPPFPRVRVRKLQHRGERRQQAADPQSIRPPPRRATPSCHPSRSCLCGTWATRIAWWVGALWVDEWGPYG